MIILNYIEIIYIKKTTAATIIVLLQLLPCD